MTDRARGILLVLTATLFWASEPLWVRKTGAHEWQILFWSGGLMALAMFVWLWREHGRNLLRAILDTGRPGILAAATLTLAYSGYILSLTRTSHGAADRRPARPDLSGRASAPAHAAGHDRRLRRRGGDGV